LDDEEENSLCLWGLPITFHVLNYKNFFCFLSALLLEKKIAIISDDLRVLSSLVLSTVPLLRPFVYPGVVVPILPSNMHGLLEAPVPFIIGLTNVDQKIRNNQILVPGDVIVVNLERKSIHSNQVVPGLPSSWARDYESAFRVHYYNLQETFEKHHIPYVTTSIMARLSKRISALFEKYFDSMFADFKSYCIRDMSDRVNPISVFLKQNFLDSIPSIDRPWFSMFLETQMFSQYCDKRLRKIDEQLRRQLSQQSVSRS